MQNFSSKIGIWLNSEVSGLGLLSAAPNSNPYLDSKVKVIVSPPQSGSLVLHASLPAWLGPCRYGHLGSEPRESFHFLSVMKKKSF